MSDPLVEELRERFGGNPLRMPSYVRELADLHERAATRIESLEEENRECLDGAMNLNRELDRLQEENERLRGAHSPVRFYDTALQQPPEQPGKEIV